LALAAAVVAVAVTVLAVVVPGSSRVAVTGGRDGAGPLTEAGAVAVASGVGATAAESALQEPASAALYPPGRPTPVGDHGDDSPPSGPDADAAESVAVAFLGALVTGDCASAEGMLAVPGTFMWCHDPQMLAFRNPLVLGPFDQEPDRPGLRFTGASYDVQFEVDTTGNVDGSIVRALFIFLD